jgi:lysophospholipase L1-like esterase
MTIEAGNAQTTFAATAVPVPPSVKILDSKGRAVPGVTVTFAVQSGGGSVSGATQVTNAQGIATVGGWVLGLGANSLRASASVVSPVTFTATGTVRVQIVTFGDSNTDRGYLGLDPVPKVGSYVSSVVSIRVPAGTANSTLQLAGKIEAQWAARRPQAIRVINHAISGTLTGTGRNPVGAPNARTEVNGVTRFAGEVLGAAFPWNGGEPTNASYPNGSILRGQAFRPRPDDFVYISIGTNDIGDGIAPTTIAANLEWMIDQWIAAGLPADHVLMTTLPPRTPANSAIPALNTLIRGFIAKGIHIIELTPIVSDDDGLTWKSSPQQSYVTEAPPVLHYAEWVRDALADLVVTYIISKTP